jgi:hypothetical protein
LLFVTVAAASAAISAAAYRPDRQGDRYCAELSAPWRAWCTLTPAERLGHVLRYRLVVSRPDAREVLRRGRAFAALPLMEQETLRMLYGVCREVLDRLPATQRSSMQSLHERARAIAIYHVLKRDMLDRLAKLREELGGSS